MEEPEQRGDGVKPSVLESLLTGQEEGWLANGKPQPHCTIQGRRLELWAEALPRSTDVKGFHTVVTNSVGANSGFKPFTSV